ncbi:hypothetical protein BJY04DRAFT_226428 [Aspergillus karnatakaensis]|uniref:putative DNA mismatch repair protein n=1 Tax=Aspergillus karnatakaensis TaxID=1810916 RepID=UPI003CCD9A45
MKMPIEALPHSTVRAIGSTSTISDPCSLVKELLDNALDASASSIVVEISQDTVDFLQVKDNGHGIPTTDHALVCQRAFTSKIQTVKDLRNVGGKSLGFRGEALASAAEVSRSLMISTRTTSDPVGSSLQYGRNGELISTQRTSHPVGTTIRITKIFHHIPVRRQTAIKNSKKTLVAIRKMVQTYAMARPSTRLSLKVLKAKNESGNWMYAPAKHATLMEAALKIAGTEIASQCMAKEWPQPSPGSSNGDTSAFKLTALLPKLGSDYTKFNSSGQYISIDGRPVSSSRGFAQALVKLYKSYIRLIASQDGLSPTITDPFLCVHINCPEGSYDVNIEPSKDDILFEDQKAALALVDALFRDTYGELPDGEGTRRITVKEDTPPRNGFEVLLSGNSNGQIPAVLTPTAMLGHTESANAHPFIRPSPPNHKRSGTTSLGRPTGKAGFVRASNMGSSRISPVRNSQGHQRTSPDFQRASFFPHGPREPRRESITPGRTPQANSFGSPSSSSAASLGSLSSISNVRQQQRENDRERYGSGALDTWFLRLSQGTQMPAAREEPQGHENGLSLSQLAQSRFGSEVTSPNLIRGLTSSRPQPIDRTPSPTSATELSQSSPDSVQQITNTSYKPGGLPVLEQWSARLYNAANPNENPELQKALEFETRKKAAIQGRRMQLKHSGSSTPASNPHENRYLAARAALSSNPDAEMLLRANSNGASKPILSPHDPRAYLMRLRETQQTDAPGSKIKRIASNKLPFEKVPEGLDLHTVGLTLPAELALLHTTYTEISKNDLYTRSGDGIEGFTSNDMSSATQHWTARLAYLTTTLYRTTDSDKIPALQFDFSEISRVRQNVAPS